MTPRLLTRGPRLALIVLILPLMLLAAACEEDNDLGLPAVEPTPAVTPEPTPTPTPPPPATPTPAPATPAPEPGEPTVALSEEGPLAPFLVGPNEFTLYYFTRDEPGVSNCTGDCLANWPPLLVEEGEDLVVGEGVTGELGTLEGPMGLQVTYNGWPLYYWIGDAEPGDTEGHEVGGVWFVVPPDHNGGGSAAAREPDDDPYAY